MSDIECSRCDIHWSGGRIRAVGAGCCNTCLRCVIEERTACNRFRAAGVGIAAVGVVGVHAGCEDVAQSVDQLLGNDAAAIMRGGPCDMAFSGVHGTGVRALDVIQLIRVCGGVLDARQSFGIAARNADMHGIVVCGGLGETGHRIGHRNGGDLVHVNEGDR
jgi:hypothetical protein